MAGTYGDHQMAVYMRDKLRLYGFDATIESFKGPVEQPVKLVLEITGKPKIGLDLRETGDPADASSGRPDAGLPFNYGSGNGDVRGAMVYANRGLEADYATLAQNGVGVRGAILLIRYGAEFRGTLAKRAQDHGAAGVVLYSDPADDGSGKGPVYPNGPYRPPGSVQRGSVQSNGVPLRIPVLPIGANNAGILMATMQGKPAPAAWIGGLAGPYVLGTTKSQVHLEVQLKRSTATLWNTIGRISGKNPMQEVVLGGHRDAWVTGVTDNGSGISTLLEAARGIGYVRQNGWQPNRSIVIAGWDGEEIGLLGSTAFVKAHATELRNGAVAYVNADENVAGSSFSASAAGAIAADVLSATQNVQEPGAMGHFVGDDWQHSSNAAIHAPGGGSDFEPFLRQIGTPTANLGFEGPFGVYHSSYDDLSYATKIADPNFERHRAMAQILGILALRLADADAVPYRFTPYVTVMHDGYDTLAGRAAAAHFMFPINDLRAAINRFAGAAAGADGSSGIGRDAAFLGAAQAVDMALYGASGYERVLFPDVSAAVDRGDAGAASRAVASTVDALNRASSLLR